MEATFSSRDDGQVDVSLGPDWPLFNEALNDSISSLPPRGAAGSGPSTYWVDVAEQGALEASERGDETPFTAGNVTRLRVRSGAVTASLDFAEDEPEEVMPLADFLAILRAWRVRILDSAAGSTSPLPRPTDATPVDRCRSRSPGQELIRQYHSHGGPTNDS